MSAEDLPRPRESNKEFTRESNKEFKKRMRKLGFRPTFMARFDLAPPFPNPGPIGFPDLHRPTEEGESEKVAGTPAQ